MLQPRIGCRQSLGCWPDGPDTGLLAEPSEHGIVALGRHPELFADDGLDPIRKHLLGNIGMRVDVVVA